MSYGGYGMPMDLPRPDAAIRDAQSDSVEVRWVAAMALANAEGAHQSPAVEALILLSRDADEDVRAQAVESLAGQIRRGVDPPSREVTAAWLVDSSDVVRCAALSNACELGVDAATAAREALGDASPAVRATAARLVGLSREKDVAEHLKRLIEDDSEAVRYEAAIALVRLGDETGIPVAAEMLETDDEDAERAAVELGRSGLSRATAVLGSAIAKRFVPKERRALLSAALARLGDAEAGQIVEEMLASRWRRTRLAAAHAIALLPFSGASNLLSERVPEIDAMEASIFVQTLAAVGAERPDEALAAMRELSRFEGLDEEVAEELREAMLSLAVKES